MDDSDSTVLTVFNVEWRDLVRQLIYFLVVWNAFAFVAVFVKSWYVRETKRWRKLDQDFWMTAMIHDKLGLPGAYIGKEYIKHQPLGYIALNLMQIVGSALAVLLWIRKSYELSTSTSIECVETICCIFFIVNIVTEWTRNLFSVSFVYSFTFAVDILSSISMLVSIYDQNIWLNLAYLRVVLFHRSINRIFAATDFLTDFQEAVFMTVSKFLTMLTIFAATMYTVEILGDLGIFQENYITAGMGEVSFFTMCYYCVVTISTVGYGDYYPNSGIGKLVAIFIIFGGILFFTNETTAILKLTSILTDGKGSLDSRVKRDHVVLTGGAIDKQKMSIIRPFLEQICHPAHGEDRPKVVLVSKSPPGRELKHFRKKWWASGMIYFLTGSVTNDEDVQRAKLALAKCVYILSDIECDEKRNEDEYNICVATAVKHYDFHVPMKIMVCLNESVELAMAAGLQKFSCVSYSGLQSLFITNSCRCPGASTLLSNMAKLRDISYIRSMSKGYGDEYYEGQKLNMHGVALKESFWGKTCGQVQQQLYAEYEILLLGVMTPHGVHVEVENALVKIDDSTVVYVLPRRAEDLFLVCREDKDWKQIYLANRDVVQEKDSNNALHVFRNAGNTVQHAINLTRHMANSSSPLRGGLMRSKDDVEVNVPMSSWRAGIDGSAIPRSLSERIDDVLTKNTVLILCFSESRLELVTEIALHFVVSQIMIQVVVLSPFKFDPESLPKNKRIAFKHGNPFSAEDLILKGRLKAAIRVVVTAQTHHDAIRNRAARLDQKGILMVSILEKCFKRIGRSVPVVVELLERSSQAYLPTFTQIVPQDYDRRSRIGFNHIDKQQMNRYEYKAGHVIVCDDLVHSFAYT